MYITSFFSYHRKNLLFLKLYTNKHFVNSQLILPSVCSTAVSSLIAAFLRSGKTLRNASCQLLPSVTRRIISNTATKSRLKTILKYHVTKFMRFKIF